MIDRYGANMPFHPFQTRLSTFREGVSFADMVDFRVDQYARAVIAENSGPAWVDETYPCHDRGLSGLDDHESYLECARELGVMPV